MKKIGLLFCFLVPTLLSAQYDVVGEYKISGNVGIGTANPNGKLHLVEDGNIVFLNGYSFREASAGFGILGYGARGSKSSPATLVSDDNTLWLRGMGFDGSNYHRVAHIGFKAESVSTGAIPGYIFFQTNDGNGTTNLVERMRINSEGHLGIGTTNPKEKIHLSNGDFFISSSSNSNFTTHKGIKFTTDNQSYYSSISTYRGGVSKSIGLQINTMNNSTTPIIAMHIEPNGNIGIGTTSTGSHKLAVEGSIGAREVKVEASSWSDFVFKNDYELRTLEELEEHIAEKGHLPEIPNEAEVTENGINLGEMNAKLLQKIEELTLYLIEQNKELKNAKNEIQELRNEVSVLKNE